MKKQIKKFIFSLILFVAMIFVTGCTLPEGQEGGGLVNPTQLTVPDDFAVTSGEVNTASWTKDENAVVYIIYIYKDNELIKSYSKTDNFDIEISEKGIYQASIKVIGDGTAYYSSDVSERVSFEYTGGQGGDITLPKLTTPTGIRVNYDSTNKQLKVEFNDSADYTNAINYKVYVYSGSTLKNAYVLTRNGGYVVVELPNGTYNVKVVAVANSAVANNSEQSTEMVTFTIEGQTVIDEFDYSKFNNYYLAAKGKTGDALEDTLRSIITSSHRKQTSYEDLKTVLQDADRDPNNPKNVITIYSQQSVKGVWDSGNTWNREHVWPNSKGVGKSGPGSDAHHLRPEDPVVNSTRGNNKIDYVSSSSRKEILFKGTVHTGCYVGSGLFEPADAVKGDVARIYFYLLTRYSNLYSYLAEAANFQTLLEWNELDPVSESEIRRNEVVFGVQGNRNPFIDNADFANLMWK